MLDTVLAQIGSAANTTRYLNVFLITGSIFFVTDVLWTVWHWNDKGDED